MEGVGEGSRQDKREKPRTVPYSLGASRGYIGAGCVSGGDVRAGLAGLAALELAGLEGSYHRVGVGGAADDHRGHHVAHVGLEPDLLPVVAAAHQERGVTAEPLHALALVGDIVEHHRAVAERERDHSGELFSGSDGSALLREVRGGGERGANVVAAADGVQRTVLQRDEGTALRAAAVGGARRGADLARRLAGELDAGGDDTAEHIGVRRGEVRELRGGEVFALRGEREGVARRDALGDGVGGVLGDGRGDGGRIGGGDVLHGGFSSFSSVRGLSGDHRPLAPTS